MRKSQSIEKNEEQGVDYDSFMQAKNEESIEEGTVQLVHYLDDEEASSLNVPRGSDVFKAERMMTDKTGYLVVEDSDWNIIESWIGTTNISGLAGSFIPVEKDDGNFYSVHQFEKIQSELGVDYDELKYLYENNCIEYKDGQWVVTGVWEEHNAFISKVQSIMSFVGFISAFSSLGFLMTDASVFMYLLLLAVWMMSLSVQMYLSTRKHKPIKTVLENVE